MYIVTNLFFFNESIKHIGVDSYFIRDMMIPER